MIDEMFVLGMEPEAHEMFCLKRKALEHMSSIVVLSIKLWNT